MIREVKYDRGAYLNLEHLVKADKAQHKDVLFEYGNSLAEDAELRKEVTKLNHNPPLYEMLVSAEEFEGFRPPEGYRITFTLSGSIVIIVSFNYIEDLIAWREESHAPGSS